MLALSSYFSIQYLVLLLPVTILLYAISPQRIRRIVLLCASYAFFWAVSGKLIVYLLLSTLSIHHFGLWLSQLQGDSERISGEAPKEQRKALRILYRHQQKGVVAFAILFHVGILVTLKYTPFFTANLNNLFQVLGLPAAITFPTFTLPIGISFYTLQAIAYIVDVYRKKIRADRNLLRLALYMSFFPQIMEGPICRYSDTAEALWQAEPLRYQNLLLGSQRILFGLMKKFVIADRLNLFIVNVFNGYPEYNGLVIAIAAIGYTIQLYMDFSGTMDVVIGSGQIFGVCLPENFKRPFFSKSISEFWRRWHITLGTWFKDYVFYPLSMSGPLKNLARKARRRMGNHYGALISGGIALFCVWFFNGLWHGAGWHYLFFGLYHFTLILLGSLWEPLGRRITDTLHIQRSGLAYTGVQIVRTAILVCIGELFFRANGLRAGLTMFQKIFTAFSLDPLRDGSLFSLGMDRADYLIVLVALVFIFIIGVYQEKGIAIRKTLMGKNTALRFSVYYALILFIIIFGAYGTGYVPVDPIYANF